MPKTNGSGTIYRRGEIWWVKIYVDGRPVYESSKSTLKTDAVRLRDKLLSKRHRGEITGGAPDRILISSLLDDVLKSDIEESTRYVWRLVVEKNLRPFFGSVRAARLSTDHMDRYRQKRKAEGRSDATVNRELSILRTAFHNGRKRTPPKVHIVPYFPMVKETTIRKGFLSDDLYARLRDELPEELRTLFVAAYVSGVRKGELLAVRWPQVDFEAGFIDLDPDKTKTGEGRVIPITKGDMRNLLMEARRLRDKNWPKSPWVFSREGEPIKDFRITWAEACKRAGAPELTFHDLRRTAVRNMRRAGVPQVIRMRISGHKTDSMERRYNIVDGDDLNIAKQFMERRMRESKTVTKTVTIHRKKTKENGTRSAMKSAR